MICFSCVIAVVIIIVIIMAAAAAATTTIIWLSRREVCATGRLGGSGAWHDGLCAIISVWQAVQTL